MERKVQDGIIANLAEQGYRIVWIPAPAEPSKTLWGGLGNRSGLHSFALTVLGERWAKGGARLTKRLGALPAGGSIIVYVYKNTTRDRGRWVHYRQFTLA